MAEEIITVAPSSPSTDSASNVKTKPLVSFGMLLREYRLDAGLTQEALAEKAGVAIRTIQALESGSHHPYRDTVRRLVRGLGLPGDQQATFEAATQPLPKRQARRPRASSAQTLSARLVASAVASLLPQTNLPASWSSFVGRKDEMVRLVRLLDRERLVMLTGAGGVGKTRLAVEAARTQVDHFADGVWYVQLAPVSNSALVASTIARTVGIREKNDRPIIELLLDTLRSRHLLLVLDNCEHLIDECAQLIQAVLGACAGVSILATSREPLRLTGEQVIRVPSLSVPIEGQQIATPLLTQFDGVCLFVDRARASSDFVLTEDNAAAVGRICRALDGIPLALELAAARISALAVEQVANLLDQQFRLLTIGDRAAPLRQQTMRATIDWSYNLLSDAEQRIWRRLAVFAGSFTLEAAQWVVGERRQVLEDGDGSCVHPSLRTHDAIDLLGRLVDKSLVVLDKRVSTPRYRLMEPLRQYAEGKLDESGEMRDARDRHGDWCLTLVGPMNRDDFGPPEVAWVDNIALDYDNLRAALDWCVMSDVDRALQLVSTLCSFWMYSGLDTEGQHWRDLLLARAPEDSPSHAHLLRVSAVAAKDAGDYGTGKDLVQRSLTMATRVGDVKMAAWAMATLGNFICSSGDSAKAEELFRQCLRLARDEKLHDLVPECLLGLSEVARQGGDYGQSRVFMDEYFANPWVHERKAWIAYGLVESGLTAHAVGELPRAEALIEQSLTVLRAVGDRPSLGRAMTFGGYLFGCTGDYRRADALLHEAIHLFRDVGHPLRVARSLFFMGLVAIRAEVYARGVTLLAAADATPGFSSTALDPVHCADRAVRLGEAQKMLGVEAADRAWATGNAMTLDQAISFGLETSFEECTASSQQRRVRSEPLVPVPPPG